MLLTSTLASGEEGTAPNVLVYDSDLERIQYEGYDTPLRTQTFPTFSIQEYLLLNELSYSDPIQTFDSWLKPDGDAGDLYVQFTADAKPWFIPADVALLQFAAQTKDLFNNTEPAMQDVVRDWFNKRRLDTSFMGEKVDFRQQLADILGRRANVEVPVSGTTLVIDSYVVKDEESLEIFLATVESTRPTDLSILIELSGLTKKQVELMVNTIKDVTELTALKMVVVCKKGAESLVRSLLYVLPQQGYLFGEYSGLTNLKSFELTIDGRCGFDEMEKYLLYGIKANPDLDHLIINTQDRKQLFGVMTMVDSLLDKQHTLSFHWNKARIQVVEVTFREDKKTVRYITTDGTMDEMELFSFYKQFPEEIDTFLKQNSSLAIPILKYFERMERASK